MPFSTIATPEAKPSRTTRWRREWKAAGSSTSLGRSRGNATGNIVGKGDVRAQARQVFENLRGVLRAAGARSREPH